MIAPEDIKVTPPDTMPRTDADPFTREWIAALPESDASLAKLGDAVWLDKYDSIAVMRHNPVRKILPDWRQFTSTAKPFFDPFTLVPPILVVQDPPDHTVARDALMRFLSPAALAPYRAAFVADAERIVDAALAKGTVDAVTDIAAAFVLKVFPDMLGMPEEGRPLVLDFGDAAFNTVGPRNAIFEESMARAGPAFEWVDFHTRRDTVTPGSLAAKILGLSDEGIVKEEEAEFLIRATLAAGFDTTVLGIANILGGIVRFPENWPLMRENPALVKNAVNEMLRYDPPARMQGRTAMLDIEVEGIKFRRGDQLSLLLTAAGRDDRRWAEADRFDVTRTGANVGFGGGIHICMGQVLARMESEVILEVLTRKVAAIEPAGKGERFINNAAVGWKHLPVRLVAA